MPLGSYADLVIIITITIIIIIIIIIIFIQEAPLTNVVFREVLKIKLMASIKLNQNDNSVH